MSIYIYILEAKIRADSGCFGVLKPILMAFGRFFTKWKLEGAFIRGGTFTRINMVLSVYKGPLLYVFLGVLFSACKIQLAHFIQFFQNLKMLKIAWPFCISGLNRGACMSAHLLLNVLNKLGKKIRCKALLSILSIFPNKFNKSNDTGAQMQDSTDGEIVGILTSIFAKPGCIMVNPANSPDQILAAKWEITLTGLGMEPYMWYFLGLK